jgi:hypothetical protein
MPLIKGFSASSFQKNVRAMRDEGREARQSIAAAYSQARIALKKAKKRETKVLREAWKKAIAAGLKGTSKASKKKAKGGGRKANGSTRSTTNQPGHLRLRVYGPPRQWSGAVAGLLTASQRAGMQKAWREMTSEQRKATKAAFRAKMRGESASSGKQAKMRGESASSRKQAKKANAAGLKGTSAKPKKATSAKPKKATRRKASTRGESKKPAKSARHPATTKIPKARAGRYYHAPIVAPMYVYKTGQLRQTIKVQFRMVGKVFAVGWDGDYVSDGIFGFKTEKDAIAFGTKVARGAKTKAGRQRIVYTSHPIVYRFG